MLEQRGKLGPEYQRLRFPSCEGLGSSDLLGGKALTSQLPKRKTKTVREDRGGMEVNKRSTSHLSASFP